MKRLLLAALVLVPAGVRAETFAHEEENWPPPPGPWKNTALVALNLTQSSFSNDWKGGNKGSLSWLAQGDFGARRQVSESFHWANQLQLRFGQTAAQVEDPDDATRTKWSKPVKSDDQILAETVGILTKGWAVDPYASVRFDSQFLDISDPRKDLWLNPIRLNEALGVAYRIARGEERESFWRAGVALRQTISKTFVDPVGDATTTNTANEGGLQISGDTKWRFVEDRVTYLGKILVFFPVFYNESDTLEEYDRLSQANDPTRESAKDFWKSPTVDWQNTFSSNITSWLAVNLYLRFVYEKYDVGTKLDLDRPIDELDALVDSATRKSVQYQQSLGVGLTYRFL
jgi:hypothetical protein